MLHTAACWKEELYVKKSDVLEGHQILHTVRSVEDVA